MDKKKIEKRKLLNDQEIMSERERHRKRDERLQEVL